MSTVVVREDDAMIGNTTIRADVVFTAVATPKMDGLTESVQRGHIDQFFRHLAAGHLANPFTMAELHARVSQLSKN